MTDKHPITPPVALVAEWASESLATQVLCTKAARWAADYELEACCEWMRENRGASFPPHVERILRAARRPQPPSLKERALAALNVIEDKMLGLTTEEKLIRRALEALPND